MSKQPENQEPETTGHSWDGIQEYNNPLPRWWLWTYYASVVFSIGYYVFRRLLRSARVNGSLMQMGE